MPEFDRGIRIRCSAGFRYQYRKVFVGGIRGVVNSMTTCQKCGKRVEQDAKFCPHCGNETIHIAKREVSHEKESVTHQPTNVFTVGFVIVAVAAILFFAGNFLAQPEFEVTYQNAVDGFEGLNSVTYVTCGVKNVGKSSGSAIVEAEFRGGGIGYEQKTQSVFLQVGEENRNIKFMFDTSFLGSLSSPEIRYRCYAKKS